VENSPTNKITQIKTVAAEGPNGPTTAMMVALNIGDPAAADAFVSEVAEQFKIQRTLAPPNTSMLLVTIIGDLSASQFANRWQQLAQTDGIVRGYMSLMQAADVIQGTRSGQQLSNASLLPAT
jgi:hypothetical protein